jgi:hypothetical protein
MSMTVTCDLFADRLADLLERDLDEPDRAALEAHALACTDCRSLLADLRKLRIDAANLPELAPSRDLWSGIAARIETPVIELQRGSQEPSNVERRRSPRIWQGLAAAGLVAITAGITRELTKRSLTAPTTLVATQQPTPNRDTAVSPSPSSAATTTSVPATRPETTVAPNPVASSPASTPFVASAVETRRGLTAEQTYAVEIARLKVIVNRRRSDLDSATVSVIDHNLQVIDDAIAQVKQALRKDPASRFLNESLDQALENKLDVLRTAAALPTRT